MFIIPSLTQSTQPHFGLPARGDVVAWPTGLSASTAGVCALGGTALYADARDRNVMTNGHTFPGSHAWSPPT